MLVDGTTRCARCCGLNPWPHLELGRGLPAPADSSTAPAAAAARAAFRVSERPPLRPPSLSRACSGKPQEWGRGRPRGGDAAAGAPLAQRSTLGWRPRSPAAL